MRSAWQAALALMAVHAVLAQADQATELLGLRARSQAGCPVHSLERSCSRHKRTRAGGQLYVSDR